MRPFECSAAAGCIPAQAPPMLAVRPQAGLGSGRAFYSIYVF